ncbi:MAG: carbon storage regulator [Planctomycetia bacterium]|nr:carbon storage regulator [Planctomycetia bacterium]
MLVLTRKVQEKIQIGQNITVTVVRVKGKAVRLGIEAPESVRISRGELGSATPQQAAHPGRAASPVTAPTAPRSAAAKSGTEPAAADGDASTHPRPESDAGESAGGLADLVRQRLHRQEAQGTARGTTQAGEKSLWQSASGFCDPARVRWPLRMGAGALRAMAGR